MIVDIELANTIKEMEFDKAVEFVILPFKQIYADLQHIAITWYKYNFWNRLQTIAYIVFIALLFQVLFEL